MNALRVLKRDILRLLKAPAALVVIGALLVLPSLYTWLNVIGFWNPYEETGNLRICVANEDAGAHSELAGDLDLGAQVVDQLKDNKQLGWTFADRSEAMRQVESGEAYAAFIIPENFSENVASLLTGNFQQPKLEFYVNEKLGAVGPKIADTGATTLDETINATFVSTVSETVAKALDKTLTEGDTALNNGKSNAAAKLAEAQDALRQTREALAGYEAATASAADKAASSKQLLNGAKADINLLSDQLGETSQLAQGAQNALTPFVAGMGGVFDQSSLLGRQAATKTNDAVGQVAATASATAKQVDTALDGVRQLVEPASDGSPSLLDGIIKQLEEQLAAMSPTDPNYETLQQTLQNLEAQRDTLVKSLDGMDALSANVTTASQDMSAASTAVTNAVTTTLAASDDYRSVLQSETLPALNGASSQLVLATGNLSGAVSNQVLLVDQALLVIDQLTATLQSTHDALAQTDGLLANLETNLDTAQTDIVALTASGEITKLLEDGHMDPAKIADFMLSPTQVHTEAFYSMNSYGTSMAPLFINLSLWVGVFMLMVILKQDADAKGIPGLTAAQGYAGRWLLLAPLVVLQATVCCAGVLAIGAQVAHVPLFFLTAMGAGLVYLCIQFALSATLQHVGKGICLLLVFVQIPGATGLYPIEMVPEFFQRIYHLLPFTYGISALRETIAGMYDTIWLRDMGVLALFGTAFFVGGMLLKPKTANANRWFARQVYESDILNGEDPDSDAEGAESNAEAAEAQRPHLTLPSMPKHARPANGGDAQ